MTTIIDQIKEDEGFRGDPYRDSLDIPTIGYGTKLPLTEAEAELIAQFRLNQKISGIIEKKPFIFRLPLERQEVIFNMTYQMGVGGVLKFKKMWFALERFDYEEAALQMLDSKWAKQTPNRAEKLARIMGGLS